MKTGSTAPSKSGKPVGHGKLAAVTGALVARVETVPDATLEELTIWLAENRDVYVHLFSVSRALWAAGFTYKKSLLVVEAGRARTRRLRHILRLHRQPRMRQTLHRLVLIEETATTTKIVRLRRSSLKGQRLNATAPFGH